MKTKKKYEEIYEDKLTELQFAESSFDFSFRELSDKPAISISKCKVYLQSNVSKIKTI